MTPPVHASVLLAMLPLAMFGTAWGVRPAPLPPAPPQQQVVAATVISEGVRKIDLDTRTFAARWLPVWGLPTPVTYLQQQQQQQEAAVEEPALPRARPMPNVVVRESPLIRRPRDICQRHGQHKVMVGRYKWRCRR